MLKYAAAIAIGAALLGLAAAPALALKQCTLSNGATKECQSCKASKCNELISTRHAHARAKFLYLAQVNRLQATSLIDGQIATPLGATANLPLRNPVSISFAADVSPLQMWSPIDGQISALLDSPDGCANADIMRVLSGLKVNLECWQKSTGNPANAVKWGSTTVWGSNHFWGMSQNWSNGGGWAKSSHW
jgi:hypothetical protein